MKTRKFSSTCGKIYELDFKSLFVEKWHTFSIILLKKSVSMIDLHDQIGLQMVTLIILANGVTVNLRGGEVESFKWIKVLEGESIFSKSPTFLAQKSIFKKTAKTRYSQKIPNFLKNFLNYFWNSNFQLFRASLQT